MPNDSNPRQTKISKATYMEVRSRFGWCASWAIWSPVGEKPKSNIADLGHFDETRFEETLGLLHADAIFVGLNFARVPDRECFSNFHSGEQRGQDYKLRHALVGTRFWGAYMTDIIKNFVEVKGTKTMAALRANPDLEKANIETFLEEVSLLGARNPLLIALGGDAHKILLRNFEDRFQIVRVPHYAMWIVPEIYRKMVHEALAP
jgi:hypothetical protein